MKKTLGILIIIFTFFMCNNVVYGETEKVYFEKGKKEKILEDAFYRNPALTNYGYFLYTIVTDGINKDKQAYCIEARSYEVAGPDIKVDFTKKTYLGDTKTGRAFISIINEVNASGYSTEAKDTLLSLTLRLFYAKLKRYTVFKAENSKETKITAFSKYPNFHLNSKTTSGYCTVPYIPSTSTDNKDLFFGNAIDCAIVKTAYNWEKRKLAKTNNNRDKSGGFYFWGEDGSRQIIKKAKSIYQNALEEYKKSVSAYYFNYDETETNSAADGNTYAYIKSNYTNKICLNNNMKTDCITNKTGNYYKIPWGKAIVTANNQRIFNIYLSSTITLYTSDTYQDMLVINPDGYSVKTTELPPPVSCRIEKSCSNLDNTCGTTDNKIESNLGIISTKVKNINGSTITLGECLKSDTSQDKENIDPDELLYKSNQKYNNNEEIYCLEKMGIYLGSSKIIVSSKGETFGVYPYLSSSLECASGTSGTPITNNDKKQLILKEYYSDFETSNINITDNSSNTKPFSQEPLLEKFDFDKLENLYVDAGYSDDLKTLPNQLYRKVVNLSSVFNNATEKEMLKFDFNNNGEIETKDAIIAYNMLSTEVNNGENFSSVYLYFLPQTLYSSPVLGKTYFDNKEYDLGYTFALNYALNLNNNMKLGSYSLNVDLYKEAFNNFGNVCKLSCSSDIYYSETITNKEYCVNPNDKSLHYYMDYYNNDTTKYSMCNIDDELNFNEAACKEEIPECNPFDIGGIDYWYRPITLNDVFPNTMNDTSKKPLLKNKYRVTGANWAVKKGRETQKEIEEDGEKIYKNNTSNTTKNKMYYKITLTPQNMKEIRDYNDTQEKDGEGYADFTLDCDDKGFECTSSFLTDLLDGNYGDYNDNEFNLSNARNWTKYTDGTAWK